MIYVPDDWIKNKASADKIHKILARLDSDLILTGDNTRDEALKELQNMGELIIVEKIENGQIVFGS